MCSVVPICFPPQVQVSMKFNGQSSVEVHPHTNLEDLKTATSISLFMRVDPDKDPIEDRFILYLGDRNVRNPGRINLMALPSRVICYDKTNVNQSLHPEAKGKD